MTVVLEVTLKAVLRAVQSLSLTLKTKNSRDLKHAFLLFLTVF